MNSGSAGPESGWRERPALDFGDVSAWQFQGFVGVLPLPAAQKWERPSFGAAQVETGAAKPLLAV